MRLRSRSLVVSLVLLAMAIVPSPSRAAAQGALPAPAPLPRIAPIPDEVASHHFTVTVGDAQSPVLHAAVGYYLLNFEMGAPTRITVTADDPHFWDRGVEVQPMRLGIRPLRNGASISFTLNGPAKLSITRPGDFFSDSEMLFLFANAPETEAYTPDTPGIRFYGPGIHHENIDAHSGDRIYIASGAVIYGSLNVWGVHDVTVSGLGTLIYDGPQDPYTDQGWMHIPNWHVIVMDNASHIRIEGITGIVRSRTWMVQMKDSHDITFRNIKIIGGNPNNANQDGMDWLGGGDTLVQDSFFRAADDVFAMQGNWEGYTEEAMLTPGHTVSNITVEDSVLSTSISNIVRLGWPQKIFNSHGFTLQNSDVIQMGVGGCGVPFALFALWADPAGQGVHTGIHFQDVRLDHWYSLLQIEQPNPGVQDVTFTRVAAMDGPALASSTLEGNVTGVDLRGVNLGGGADAAHDLDVPLTVQSGAAEPSFAPELERGFGYSGGAIRPGKRVKFSAPKRKDLHYQWIFGDGTPATIGRAVHHTFADADGTLLDGTGRFRVLLAATDTAGHVHWSAQSVVAGTTVQRAVKVSQPLPGLGAANEGAPRSQSEYQSDSQHEIQSNSQHEHQNDGHGSNQSGWLRVPATGGYTVYLLTSTTASLTVDGVRVASRPAHAQVCGSPGNAVEALQVSLVLARGDHRIELTRGPEVENAGTGAPVLLWEGPGIARQPIPPSALRHTAPQL